MTIHETTIKFVVVLNEHDIPDNVQEFLHDRMYESVGTSIHAFEHVDTVEAPQEEQINDKRTFVSTWLIYTEKQVEELP